jgi:uncharacterized protein YeeX (DUF496 family)
MNADTETMRYFEKPLSIEESQAMMDRMHKMYEDRGNCYFAVELLKKQRICRDDWTGLEGF